MPNLQSERVLDVQHWNQGLFSIKVGGPLTSRWQHLTPGDEILLSSKPHGTLPAALGLPPLDAATDRAMHCGSPGTLADLRAILDARGFRVSEHIGDPGDYVFERGFLEQ